MIILILMANYIADTTQVTTTSVANITSSKYNEEATLVTITRSLTNGSYTEGYKTNILQDTTAISGYIIAIVLALSVTY